MALLAWRILTGRLHQCYCVAILAALELAFIFLLHQGGIVLVGFILFKFIIDSVRGT
jgi:hypothetical protein